MRTYYEITDDTGAPATRAQRKAHGTPAYGYPTLAHALIVFRRYAKTGWRISERHCNGCADWAGETITIKTEGV